MCTDRHAEGRKQLGAVLVPCPQYRLWGWSQAARQVPLPDESSHWPSLEIPFKTGQCIKRSSLHYIWGRERREEGLGRRLLSELMCWERVLFVTEACGNPPLGARITGICTTMSDWRTLVVQINYSWGLDGSVFVHYSSVMSDLGFIYILYTFKNIYIYFLRHWLTSLTASLEGHCGHFLYCLIYFTAFLGVVTS